jgi:hypothetical protein
LNSGKNFEKNTKRMILKELMLLARSVPDKLPAKKRWKIVVA